METTEVLNPKVLERIRNVGGTVLVDKLLTYFLTSAPSRFQQLTEAIHHDDWKAVEYHAHSLKSSSGNVGADSLRFILNEIEVAAEEERGEAVRAAEVSLETHFDEFLQALQRLRNPA